MKRRVMIGVILLVAGTAAVVVWCLSRPRPEPRPGPAEPGVTTQPGG